MRKIKILSAVLIALFCSTLLASCSNTVKLSTPVNENELTLT